MCVRPVQVWNPCFDVTPGRLVEGIITEEGLVPRDSGSGSHKVAAFMAARQQAQAANGTGGERVCSTGVRRSALCFGRCACMHSAPAPCTTGAAVR